MKEKTSKNTSSQIREQLSSIHRTIGSKERQNVLFGAFIVLISWLLLILLVEESLFLNPSIKAISFILLSTFFLFALYKGLKEIRPQSFESFYRKFSRSSKLEELKYALDLESSTNANPKLVEAAIFKNLEQVEPLKLQQSLSSYLKEAEISKKLLLKQILGILSFILLCITMVSLPNASKRLSQFWVTFEKPNPYNYSVTPGKVTLEQGSSFAVSANFTGELPLEVVLKLKTSVEEEFRSRNMDINGSMFSSVPFDLNNDILYYLEMDGFKSELFSASVQLLPRLSSFELTVTPPSYTRLKAEKFIYPFSQVQAYQGSEIAIKGATNKELGSLLLINASEEVLLETDSLKSFEHTISVSTPDTFSFKLLDKSGLENKNPFQFTISPLPDALPYVELIQPSASFEAVDPQQLELLFKSSDDFGLTSGSLNYELTRAFVETPISKRITLSRPVNGVIQNYTFDLSTLNLKPKDQLTFWIEVNDNDEHNGFKSARSQEITLTVPSLIDFFEDIGEKEDEVETDLEDISDAFEEMSNQYETFKEQLKEDPSTNFEQKRQLEEVQRQQEEIEKKIEELNEKFDEIKEELSENNMLSEETMEAYKELQELMEEIDDPSFREALEKMQEQMSEMSPEQLRDALQEAEFNEELYKQRIERTLELFKQLKLNSDLEKLAQTYEDLARQEEELANESISPEQEQEQRESTLDQAEQLEERIDQLSENTTDKTEESIEGFQELSKSELAKIQEELKEMLENLKEESEGEASSPADPSEGNQKNENSKKNAAESFKKMASMTRQQMQQMQQEQIQINVAGLQYILYSLLNLSIEQEDLVSYATTTENRSQAYIEYARDQKNVQGIFKILSDSLFQLSTEIPPFSNQINTKKEEVEIQLAKSLLEMAERNQSKASIATRQALGGINEISFLIANLLEQLQDQDQNGSGGSGSGMSMQQMIEQMQQMGEGQKQLNQQMQDLINDMQGERLTQDQMGRLDQLSKQQNEIRKQLQQLQRNGELEGGDELGSQLERMIEEMEDTINDLRGGAVDRTLIERQQNILSRMLEAEKALQERDEEEKREGTTGVDVNRATPPDLTLEELEKQIRNRLNDPNFTKYSTDYQRLIEKYFELLRQIQERELQ